MMIPNIEVWNVSLVMEPTCHLTPARATMSSERDEIAASVLAAPLHHQTLCGPWGGPYTPDSDLRTNTLNTHRHNDKTPCDAVCVLCLSVPSLIYMSYFKSAIQSLRKIVFLQNKSQNAGLHDHPILSVKTQVVCSNFLGLQILLPKPNSVPIWWQMDTATMTPFCF